MDQNFFSDGKIINTNKSFHYVNQNSEYNKTFLYSQVALVTNPDDALKGPLHVDNMTL